MHFASFISTLDHGKPHLNHWGVLVSDLSVVDAQAIMLRTRASSEAIIELGTMYELFREEDGRNNVSITRPVTVEKIHEEWPAFSANYIGETEIPYETITSEGKSLVSVSCLLSYS
jgi:hypothetical protein